MERTNRKRIRNMALALGVLFPGALAAQARNLEFDAGAGWAPPAREAQSRSVAFDYGAEGVPAALPAQGDAPAVAGGATPILVGLGAADAASGVAAAPANGALASRPGAQTLTAE